MLKLNEKLILKVTCDEVNTLNTYSIQDGFHVRGCFRWVWNDCLWVQWRTAKMSNWWWWVCQWIKDTSFADGTEWIACKLKTLYEVKLSVSTPWRHKCQAEIYLYSFLIFLLDVGHWSTSSFDHLTPRRDTKHPLNSRLGGTHMIWKREKISYPGRDSNPRSTSL